MFIIRSCCIKYVLIYKGNNLYIMYIIRSCCIILIYSICICSLNFNLQWVFIDFVDRLDLKNVNNCIILVEIQCWCMEYGIY